MYYPNKKGDGHERRYQGSNLGFGNVLLRIPSDNHYTIAPLGFAENIILFRILTGSPNFRGGLPDHFPTLIYCLPPFRFNNAYREMLLLLEEHIPWPRLVSFFC